ncbi:MAG: hypothetical protein R3Y59_09915 [bacterium]
MKRYYKITIILTLIGSIGIFILAGQRGDVHFKSYEYTPEDWVTTKYTLFSTDLSNKQPRDEYNYKWESLPVGLQLKPIIRYRHGYAVVDLPDGRRGLVAPSTLSGTFKDGEFRSQSYFGDSMTEKEVKKYGKIKKETNDSTLSIVAYITGKEYFHKQAKGFEKPKDYGLPYIIINSRDSYTAVCANKLWPNFAEGMPVYYDTFDDEFKVYVSKKKLESMTQDEIDSKYGEPISISPLSDGGKLTFYRHIRTKQSYNYEGIFIKYKADGTTTVADPRNNANEYTIDYVANKARPLLSRITSIDWVDLPFAFPLISMFHLNFSDITTDTTDDSFPYIWVFIGTFILSIVVLYMLIYLTITIFFPIKFLSNSNIEIIATLIAIVPIMIIGVLYMELFQGLWIILALITAFMIFIPWGFISNELEFNRCDYCRKTGSVTHTKNLIDTKVSTRVDTYDHDDEKTNYDWNGDIKSEIITHKRDYKLIETTDNKFRYDFHCSHCNRDWKTIKTESNDRTLAKRTDTLGKTKRTWRKVYK